MKHKNINIKDIARYNTLSAKEVIEKIEIEQEKELIGLIADEMRGYEALEEYQNCQNCSGYTTLLDDTGLCEKCKIKEIESEIKKRSFFVLRNYFEVTEEKYKELKEKAYQKMIDDVKYEIEENKKEMKELGKKNEELEEFLNEHLKG